MSSAVRTLALVLLAAAGLPAQSLLAQSPPTRSQPAAGKLLISEKHLLDPNFSRTVVLLVEHDDNATLGLVVNRPTSFRVARLLPQVQAMADREERIFIGGPVGAEQVWLLSQTAVEGGKQVVEGVWSTSSSVDLDRLAADAESKFRVFGGYAGWGPGQLQDEIDRGDWRLLPASAARVFDSSPETLWTRLYEQAAVRFAFAR